MDGLLVKWKEAITRTQAVVITPAPIIPRASSSRRFRVLSSGGRLLFISSWKIVRYSVWALSSPLRIATILARKALECGLVLAKES
jgi:hypothetical protein